VILAALIAGKSQVQTHLLAELKQLLAALLLRQLLLK